MIDQTLGRYRILDKLGVGGMGEVYLAHDGELDRRVALKVLPREMAAKPQRLQRFRREAKTLAALHHPNIVTVYSVEEVDGVHFLTMELVEGKTLAGHVPKRGTGLKDFFDIAIPLADALSTAHEGGVVHRDLKPGNVMVTGKGEVKVLDFGLAKLITPAGETAHDTLAPTEELTAEGRIIGTVPFMSPEQVKGQPVDARTDIFSLGILLYHLATGDLPFKGATSAELVSSILRDMPSSVDALKGEMPHHLGRIIRRCLQKDPERRYQSAKEVRNELDDLQREVTGGERETAPAFRALRRRGRAIAWAVAVVALLALAAIAIWRLPPRRSPVQPRSTVGAEAQALLDQGYLLELRGSTREYLSQAEDRYRRALQLEPDNPTIAGRLACLLAGIQLQYPEEGRPEEIRRLAAAVLEKDPDSAAARIALGYLAILDQDPTAAAAQAERAIAAAPDDYRGYTLMGEALVAQDRVDEGLVQLRQGVTLAGTDIRARLALAFHLWRLGRVNEAAAEYETVLDYAPDAPAALNNLGIIYGQQGRLLDAVPLFRRLLVVGRDVDAAINLAACYFHLQRPQDAIEAYQQALEIDPDHAYARHGLAEAFELLGDQERARQEYEKAVAAYDRRLAGGATRWRALGLRAVCAAKLGRYDEALENIAEAERLEPDAGTMLFNAAQVRALAGQRREAFRYARQAIEAGYARQEIERDLSFRAYLDDPEFRAVLETASRP